jgi:hypothetical protein
VGFILWMIYWVGIASCSRLLDRHDGGVTEASSIA